jgi:hypothetical protein
MGYHLGSKVHKHLQTLAYHVYASSLIYVSFKDCDDKRKLTYNYW